MKIVKEGEVCKALCHDCGMTTGVYKLRDIPFEGNPRKIVKNVLACVCEKCSKVIAVPRQSVPAIKAECRKKNSPLEVRLPAHYLDILNLAAQKIDPNLDETAAKKLFIYYVHALRSNHFPQKDFHQLLSDEASQVPASKRLSIKGSANFYEDFNELKQQQSVNYKTELVKGVILQINEDIVQEESSEYITELRRISSIL